jgi:hypothetical protein
MPRKGAKSTNGDSANTPEASLFHCHERGGKPLEYVTVTTRLWKDRWVRSLTPDAKLLWLYLISHDSDYGFYEYDPEAWAMETGLDFMLINDLIIQFSEANKIAIDGDLVLVIKALQHRRLSTRDYDYAVNSIKRRYGVRAPQLVSLCLARNPADSGGTVGSPESSESDQNQNQIKDTAKPKRIRPLCKPLAEIEAEQDQRVLRAWADFKAMVAEQNKTGEVSPNRLARLLTAISTAAQHERLFITQVVYGLDQATLKGAANANYVLAAARGHTPPDIRTDADYYAGSAEHQARKRESVPQTEREVEVLDHYAELEAANNDLLRRIGGPR